MSVSDLHQLKTELHTQMQDGALLDKTSAYAKHYLAECYSRRLAPSNAALAALEVFREPLPSHRGDLNAIVNQLYSIGGARPGQWLRVGY